MLAPSARTIVIGSVILDGGCTNWAAPRHTRGMIDNECDKRQSDEQQPDKYGPHRAEYWSHRHCELNEMNTVHDVIGELFAELEVSFHEHNNAMLAGVDARLRGIESWIGSVDARLESEEIRTKAAVTVTGDHVMRAVRDAANAWLRKG